MPLSVCLLQNAFICLSVTKCPYLSVCYKMRISVCLLQNAFIFLSVTNCFYLSVRYRHFLTDRQIKAFCNRQTDTGDPRGWRGWGAKGVSEIVSKNVTFFGGWFFYTGGFFFNIPRVLSLYLELSF